MSTWQPTTCLPLNLLNCQSVNLSTRQPVDLLNRKYFDLSTVDRSTCQHVNLSTRNLSTYRLVNLSSFWPDKLSMNIRSNFSKYSICLNIKILFYSFKIKKNPSTRYPCLYKSQIINKIFILYHYTRITEHKNYFCLTLDLSHVSSNLYCYSFQLSNLWIKSKKNKITNGPISTNQQYYLKII